MEARGSIGRRWTYCGSLMEATGSLLNSCKQAEVCRNTWKLAAASTEYGRGRVRGSSRQLQQNMVFEASADGSNGSFHFHEQWKFISNSNEAPIDFHGRIFTSMEASTSFHGATMEVDRKSAIIWWTRPARVCRGFEARIFHLGVISTLCHLHVMTILGSTTMSTAAAAAAAPAVPDISLVGLLIPTFPSMPFAAFRISLSAFLLL